MRKIKFREKRNAYLAKIEDGKEGLIYSHL
jgi:hypothetical protein